MLNIFNSVLFIVNKIQNFILVIIFTLLNNIKQCIIYTQVNILLFKLIFNDIFFIFNFILVIFIISFFSFFIKDFIFIYLFYDLLLFLETCDSKLIFNNNTNILLNKLIHLNLLFM